MAASLSILSKDIRMLDGLFSLNDLHKASGGLNKHSPRYWTSNEQTKGLIKEIEKDGIPSISKKPRLGTYVCRELVYAYAMWISPEFYLKFIQTFDQVTSGGMPEQSQMFESADPLEINTPVEYLGRRCLTVGDIERIHSRPGYVMDKFRQLLGQGHFEYGRHYFLLSIRADGMDRIGVADGPAEYVLTVTGYQMLMAGVDMALVERVIAEYFSVGALESTEPAEIAYYAEAFRLLQVWQNIQQIEDGAERVVQILDWEGQVNGHLSTGVQGGRFARQAEADALLVRFVRLLAGGTGSPQENVKQMGDFQMKALSWSERHRLLH